MAFTGPIISCLGYATTRAQTRASGGADETQPAPINVKEIHSAVKTSEAIVDALKKRTVTAQEANTLNTTYFFTHWYPSLKRIRVKQVGLIKREKLGNKFVGAEQTISDNEKSNGVDSAGIDLTKPQNGNSTWAVLRGFLITVAEAAGNATGLSGAAAPEFGADKSPHIAQLPDTDLVKTLVREDENIAARFSGRDIDSIEVLQMKAYSQSHNIADAILQSDFGDKFLQSYSRPKEGDKESVNDVLSKINRQECTEEQTFTYDFQHAMRKVICPFVKGITNESSAQSYETAAFQTYNSLMSVTVGEDDASIPEIYRENLDECKRALKTIESDSAAYIAKFSEVLKKTDSVELQEALDEMRTKMGAKFRDVVYDFLTNAYTIMVDEKRQPATEATGTEGDDDDIRRKLQNVLDRNKAASGTDDERRWEAFLEKLTAPPNEGGETLLNILQDANSVASLYKENTHQDSEVSKVADFVIDLSELVFQHETITFDEFYSTVTQLQELIGSISTTFLNDTCKRRFKELNDRINTVASYMHMYETNPDTLDNASRYGIGVRIHINGAVEEATELLETDSCTGVESRSEGTQVVYTVPNLAPTVSSMEGAKRVSKQIKGGYYGLW